MKSTAHAAGMVNTTVRLPVESVAALDRLGAARERTRNYLIRKAVTEFLKRERASAVDDDAQEATA